MPLLHRPAPSDTRPLTTSGGNHGFSAPRLVRIYTLAFFNGLRACAAWIEHHTANDWAASSLVIGLVLVAFAVLSMLPRWLVVAVGIAGTVPYAFILYMFLRQRLHRRR